MYSINVQAKKCTNIEVSRQCLPDPMLQLQTVPFLIHAQFFAELLLGAVTEGKLLSEKLPHLSDRRSERDRGPGICPLRVSPKSYAALFLLLSTIATTFLRSFSRASTSLSKP
jgi:hypothetical protein